MYRNIPAVKPTIHRIASSLDEAARPTYNPIMHVKAEIKFQSKAFMFDIPELTRTAKSPALEKGTEVDNILFIQRKQNLQGVPKHFRVRNIN